MHNIVRLFPDYWSYKLLRSTRQTFLCTATPVDLHCSTEAGSTVIPTYSTMRKITKKLW